MEKIKQILPAVLSHLNRPEVSQRQKLTLDWPKIAGKVLAEKTQARIAPGGKLTVWVSESALAYEIQQKYKTTLLKRAQAALGEKEIKDLIVRVGQLR
jgi:hypothetical protein